MTNAWGDISNTKLIMALGSNFVENHPGVVQQVNAAFENNAAKFVAVDPRRTRTVVWGEQHASGSAFARIRPGTNGALICGLMNYAITNTAMTGVASGNTATEGTTTTLTASDVTFNVNELVDRYIRLTGAGFEPSWRKITANTTTTVTFTPAANENAEGTYEICKRPLVDSVFLYNNTDGPLELLNDHDATGAVDYVRSVGVGTGVPQYAQLPRLTNYADKYSPNKTWEALQASGSVFNALKARMAKYDPATVEQICGITHAEFTAVANMITDPLNRPGSILYAMGGTQHTHAAQDLHAYCLLQLVLGNMGKSGGGVNALRGIHNVQGSTDQGLLYSSMPAYSDVPDTDFGNDTYKTYMNSLFGSDNGYGLQQRGFHCMMNSYFRQTIGIPATKGAGVQYNGPYVNANCGNYDFDLLPKDAGYNHRKMFQYAQAAETTGVPTERVRFMMCLGQNPAVTEPNLGEIRKGLHDLDTLVCVDMYMSETATCDRKEAAEDDHTPKEAGRTILLPSCAHVEEAGTVTNSARLIYWRYMATPAKEGSRNDLWILLKLAKALDDPAVNAFNHIKVDNGLWAAAHGGNSVYKVLYGYQYHCWDPDNVPDFRNKLAAASGAITAATGAYHPNGLPRYMGEAVAEEVFKQMAVGTADGGAVNPRATTFSVPTNYERIYGSSWIYASAYQIPPASPGQNDPKYGTKLAAATGVGAKTITVSHDDMSAQIYGADAGTELIIGNIGAPGASGVATASGGNEETAIVASVSNYTIDLASGLTKDHSAGELVTPKGMWSADARDGILVKSRATYDPGDNKIYGRFAWAWLYNRHVFYNTNPCGGGMEAGGSYSVPPQYYICHRTQPGSVAPATPRTGERWRTDYLTHCETVCENRPVKLNALGVNVGGNGTCKAPGDTYDYWVAPDARARLFVHHADYGSPKHVYPAGHVEHDDAPDVRSGATLDGYPAAAPEYFDRMYRKYSTFADWDHHNYPNGSGATGYPSRPTRFPKHWEPHESPEAAYTATYGRTGDNPVDDLIGSAATYPLALTTFRICWHFQGGVMTRNVPWLAELDPDPYIEINSMDAFENGGIKTGDDVYIHTARLAAGSGPYKARVGTGSQANQNIKRGVVGIPWHWGEAMADGHVGALVEGPSANESCIDAMDTNIKMPESKACLCRLTHTDA